MLNVMLVDDESLVRLGLRHGIAWEDFNMRVVEDADSVARAKELLTQRRDIDLVFADIVMPGETGLELVRWIKIERPMLPVVMLTYHDDFSYVQEALRLGAADYIHKSEVEQKGLHITLKRIAGIAEQQREAALAMDSPATGAYAQALVVVGMPEYEPPEEARCECRRMGGGNLLLLFPAPSDEALRVKIENQLNGDALLLFFDDIGLIRIPDLLYCAKLFMNQEYFYRKLPNLRIYELDAVNDSMVHPALNLDVYHWIEEELSSLNWLNDNGLFLKILSTIQHLRLPPDTVGNLFFGVRLKWRHVLRGSSDETPFRKFDYWYQWADWIANLRRTLMVQSGLSRYSPTILSSVQRLMVYLDDHFTEDISISSAAKMVSLSESYFSKCFRGITRKSFHNYLCDLRLSYALKLLTSTHLSVARIAELSGFSDSVHFIKRVKSQCGMTPGVYRARHTDTTKPLDVRTYQI